MNLLHRITRLLTAEKTAPQQMPVAGISGLLPGYPSAAPGTYSTYRQMRAHPTLAMARLIATAPFRTTPIEFVATHGTEEQRLFMQETLNPLWANFVQQACFAFDYGWKGFEKVFAVTPAGRLTLARLKPLNVDRTRILVDENTGAFAGLRQRDVTLPAEKVFVFTHDMEDDDRYGRSRHENVRGAWNAWNELLKKEGQYIGKIAGVVPIVKYPEGTGRDRTGALRSNFELAQAVLANLGKGHGVAMPNQLAGWAEDMTRAGLDVSQLAAWQITFLEAGASHAHGFIEQMRHKESLMMRGWLVPERAALESSTGTRADAEAHGRVALSITEAVFEDLLRCVNRFMIDQLLMLNWGESARGGVVARACPADGARATMLRQIAVEALKKPADLDLLRRAIDFEKVLESTGIPAVS